MDTLITKEQILALARLFKDGEVSAPHDGKKSHYTVGMIDDGALRFRTSEGDYHLNANGRPVV